MGELGLLGPTIPEQYGGPGLNYVAYGLIAREVERVDSGYRSMMSVQSSLVMVPIFEFGTEAQRQKYLPKLATGEWIGCFGLTEPDHGSDPGSMATRAQKVAGGYKLSGAKMWISNSPMADVFVVWAKEVSESGAGRPDSRLCAGKRHEGPERPRHPRQGRPARLHHRRNRHGRRVLPEENAFPEVQGLKGPFTCLNSARYGIAWGALGAAEDCWFRARQYVHGPQTVRPPAGRQPADPEEAGRHANRNRAGPARLPAPGPHEGRGHGVGRDSPRCSSATPAAKSLDIARLARDMMGGNGISDEFGVARHLVNLEVVNTYEGTHDIHALILGRAQTGIAAFSN